MRGDKVLRFKASRQWPLILVTFALALAAYFLMPLVDGLILGTVFAYVGRPVRDLFGTHRRLGSLVATVGIVIPISIILGLGAIEIANMILWLASNQDEILGLITSTVSQMDIPPWIFEEMKGSLQNVIGIVTAVVASIPVFNLGRTISLGSINLIISLPVCYFLLMDGDAMVKGLMDILPRKNADINRKYIERIDSILSGVFLGSIYTAMVGGLISAIVFYFFGVDKPFAMACFVFIAGLVPILTAWAVIVPLTVIRYLTLGASDALLFFVVSSSLIYLPSEMVVRPYLVSTRSTIHPLLVMVSFLGGMLVAGLGGFFLAPALMGVVVGVYQVYGEERRKRLEVGGTSPPPGTGGS